LVKLNLADLATWSAWEKQQIPKQHLFGLGLCGSPWNSHRFTISNRDKNRFSREHAAAWVHHNRLAAGWLGDPSHTMLAHCFSIGMYGSVDSPEVLSGHSDPAWI